MAKTTQPKIGRARSLKGGGRKQPKVGRARSVRGGSQPKLGRAQRARGGGSSQPRSFGAHVRKVASSEPRSGRRR